jgi:hypothetical protein
MKDNFDLGKFLTENKLTFYGRITSENKSLSFDQIKPNSILVRKQTRRRYTVLDINSDSAKIKSNDKDGKTFTISSANINNYSLDKAVHENEFGGMGLIVKGETSKDNDLIDQAVEESGFYGVYNSREDYWFFPEEGDQSTMDRLENELENIFIKKGANVSFEGQFNENLPNTAKTWKTNPKLDSDLEKASEDPSLSRRERKVFEAILAGYRNGDYGRDRSAHKTVHTAYNLTTRVIQAYRDGELDRDETYASFEDIIDARFGGVEAMF